MMPALFIGHGSPLNALAKNSFTQSLKTLGESLPRPKSILMISAHWETDGTQVLKVPAPKTIHDFYGFPRKFFEIQYPAPGAEDLADRVFQAVAPSPLNFASDWGFDHGSWSVLLHLLPRADIPVTQLSLNRNMTLREHFNLAQQLIKLRSEEVLVIGSGNIVHNLRKIEWEPEAPAADFAIDFDAHIARDLESHNFAGLLDPIRNYGEALTKAAHPTLEHYLPLIYWAGLATERDQISFPCVGIQNSSISMRAAMASRGS